jgi:hypothetical protein
VAFDVRDEEGPGGGNLRHGPSQLPDLLIGRARRAYWTAAGLAFNTGLLFLLANLVAWLFLSAEAIHGGRAGAIPVVRRFGLERVARAYPGLSRPDLLDLLTETEKVVPFEYEPFTEFRTASFTGRFVNVSPVGFRLGRDQGPWPPDPSAVRLFVFGGSTANGLGLADGSTLPSRLQARLRTDAPGRRIDVYNFARPGHFSVQERILFEQLLLYGAAPDAAVFFDGLNDLFLADHQVPPYLWAGPKTEIVRALVERHRRTDFISHTADWLRALPIVKALGRLFPGMAASFEAGPPFSAGSAERAVAVWRANKRLIEAVASLNGVRTLFVWQPVPFYRYDLRFHLFREDGLLEPRSTVGYDAARRAWEGGELGPDFLWLADTQEGKRENLYIDGFHYTAAFTDELAGALADALVARGFLAESPSRGQ